MLTIDDNMFKLIKMQESLLKVATGDRSYHLSNYVKNVMMIDKKLFDELVDIIKGASKYNQTLEDELVHLEKVKSAYNQVLEFQMRFRNVCESYGRDDLELSDMSLLNIKYIDERISVISGYLTNIKNIEENKDKLEELNDKLVNEEKKREFLEKKIELFEKKLREDFIHASLKQVVFGKLESYDIIFEYSKLGYDAVRLLDNPLELDNKYRNIDIQASEVTEKYEAARLCYNNLFDNDSKNILSEIEKEFYLTKYKYIMLKLLKLLVSEANTYELAKVKRENFVELINSRSKCLEKLKINNPLNILSAVDIEGQMNEINELSVCIKSIHDTRKKISELSSRTESMINENNSYLISLSDTKELIRSKVSFKDVDITTFDDIIIEEVKKKATPLENQVVGVKSVSSSFKLIISKQKANSVITRICSIYLKEDEKTRKASADLVEETPELVIVSEKEEIRDDVSHVGKTNEEDAVLVIEPVVNEVTVDSAIATLEAAHPVDLSLFNDQFEEIMSEPVREELFETVTPFSAPIMFMDRTDNVVNGPEVKMSVQESVELPSLTLGEIDSGDMMPDAFWVVDDSKEETSESTGLSFDEQINALLADSGMSSNARIR